MLQTNRSREINRASLQHRYDMGMMHPLQKWAALKMGAVLYVTDADLDWLCEHLDEPDATRFHRDLSTTHHNAGYQARMTQEGPYPQQEPH